MDKDHVIPAPGATARVRIVPQPDIEAENLYHLGAIYLTISMSDLQWYYRLLACPATLK